MNKITLLSAVFTFVVVVVGCSVLRGATALEDMSDAGAAAYASRTAFQMELLTQTALAEEDIDREDVLAISVALRAVRAGSPAGFISSRLGSTGGYERLALTLALLELEGKISLEGIVTLRGAAVLEAVADRLEAIQ
jgi:hypothetical protein